MKATISKEKKISSKDNPLFKSTSKLLRKKYRDETGMYLVEGVKPIEDAAIQGIELETVFVRESAKDREWGFAGEIIILQDDLFDQLSDTENSQGVIGVVRKKKIESALSPEASGESGIIVLDRLQDPGNIGTIIRTAEAAGFLTVIAIKGTGDIYSPKVVRAAAGSLFRMKIIEGLDTDGTVCFCRKTGCKIIVSSLEDSTSCFDIDLTNSAIVIGNEGKGVSQGFLMAADKKVKIPMQGKIESLNAAVAAGVLMFESARQHAAGKVK